MTQETWKCENHDEYRIYSNYCPYPLGQMFTENFEEGVVEHNTRLLAAAPELLAALEMLTYEAEKRGGVPKEFILQSRAVIKKAKGE